MVDGEVIAYSIASFLCALFVLEFGADKFVDNTAIVAKRTGIPQGVIALLTAGAEWEEVCGTNLIALHQKLTFRTACSRRHLHRSASLFARNRQHRWVNDF